MVWFATMTVVWCLCERATGSLLNNGSGKRSLWVRDAIIANVSTFVEVR